MKIVDIPGSTKFLSECQGARLIFAAYGGHGIYDCSISNKYTNMGFRLAYFLWIMRGSNSLSELNFYSKHVNKMSDNGTNLRGAYGPRLRFWVGPDQLQEAIKTNQDIDKEEDMVKPHGIDQLRKVFDDLSNGQKVSICQIFDPSIDFDDSNDIPDLFSIVFDWGDCLNMNAIFGVSTVNGHFINDYFFLSLLHVCMANLLDTKPGITSMTVHSASTKHLNKYKHYSISASELILPANKDVDSLFEDIYGLCELERHLRTSFTVDAISRPSVDLRDWADKLIEKFVDTRSCAFWVEYGLALVAYVLTISGGDKYKEYVKEKCISRITGSFKKELE